MAQKKSNSKTKKTKTSAKVRNNVRKKENLIESKAIIRDEIIGVVLVAVGIFLIVALQTHAAGIIGNGISSFLKGMFGFAAYFLPYCVLIYGVLLFIRKTIHTGIKSVVFLLIIYLMTSVINAGRFIDPHGIHGVKSIAAMYNDGVNLKGGGLFGQGVGDGLAGLIGLPGLYIFCIVVIFIFVLLLVNTPVSRFFESLKAAKTRRALEREEKAKERAEEERERALRMQMELETAARAEAAGDSLTDGQKKIMDYVTENVVSEYNPEKQNKRTRLRKEKKPAAVKTAGAANADLSVAEYVPSEPSAAPEKLTKVQAAESRLDASDFNNSASGENYSFPPVELLSLPRQSGNRESASSIRAKAAKLEQTLRNFNIGATVTNVEQGPAVTRYEIHPDSGVKVSAIKNLQNDIALNMEAKSLRMEAPIPGKAAVGIEIENDNINMVTIREIIESDEFADAQSRISFAVGRDIAGKAVVGDLKAMPHMLIAGSTGSGKSVCVNSIITSILYKARPDEVKLVLIDPKVVELSNYNGIPHLLIPVVTDPAKAAAALNWAVGEMEERYKKFAEEGVRGLAGYNTLIEKKNSDVLRNAGKDDPVTLQAKMPQIVIIIDELADLMMASSKQVEESICRLAQKARAAGMHLIVATQRPSVDVITGLIKANIPSRIAFAVASQVDSKTILDMVGAEKLVGKGDMLFSPLGAGKPKRIQGTFISDREVAQVIEFVKSQAKTDESAEADVLDRIERANIPDAEKGNRDFEDDLLPEAIELVADAGQASVSMLQRRFRIGYNRAARIIDMMEERQIIGASEGSKPRQVLISRADLDMMREATEDMEE